MSKNLWEWLWGKRTKAGRGRWEACTAGGCKDVENLTVPKPLRTGTGAIRQELLINSHLSAPQIRCVQHLICPVLRGFGTPRFSHVPADARRTRLPPAPACFLFFGNRKMIRFSLFHFPEHITNFSFVIFFEIILVFNLKCFLLQNNVKHFNLFY